MKVLSTHWPLWYSRYTSLVKVWPFRTALILHKTLWTRCWKHSSEILVHIDVICRMHVGCMSMTGVSRSTTSTKVLLDWDLVTVEAVGGQKTHWHVQETSLRRYELCDLVHYLAESGRLKMATLRSLRGWHGQQQFSGRQWWVYVTNGVKVWANNLLLQFWDSFASLQSDLGVYIVSIIWFI